MGQSYLVYYENFCLTMWATEEKILQRRNRAELSMNIQLKRDESIPDLIALNSLIKDENWYDSGKFYNIAKRKEISKDYFY